MAGAVLVPFSEGPHPGDPNGEQKLYYFPNGYGASVVRFRGSYGYQKRLWELAVLKLGDNDNWTLCYTTPLTDDVMGNLTEGEVKQALIAIAALPSSSGALAPDDSRTVEADKDDLAHLLLCAFRYSLGRRTYIVSTCVRWLKTHWGLLPVAWQKQIHEDIEGAITKDCAGDACDIESWRSVLALPLTDGENV